MKKRFKKALALACAGVLALSVLAGCGGKAPASTSANNGGSEPSSEAVGENLHAKKGPLANPVTLSILMPSHPSWPYQDDWYVWDVIREYTNVSFDVVSADIDGFADKANLTMAGGDLPDMIQLTDTMFLQQYAAQGAFVNVLDYLDQMPNFKKWYEENKLYAANFLSADGNLYAFPQKGVEETNRRIWMYRADVFEDLGLKAPTTKDEFYNVLVALKQAYPDSYPLGWRSFDYDMRQINMLAPSWGTDFTDIEDSRCFYYDYDAKEFKFGPTSAEYKEMLEFYNKLYKEGLMIPNFLTIDTKGWQDVIANSDSFITLDYISRISFFNNAMQPSNPDFSMEYLAPPVFNEKVGDKLAYSSKAYENIAVSSTSKNLDAVLAYIDWLYTDEAEDVMSWGRPGELYTEAADGTRKWNDFATAADMKKGTGLQTYGVYLRYNFDAESSTFGPENQVAFEEAPKHDLPQQPVLVFTEEEQEVMDTIGMNIINAVYEQTSKFLVGERSFDEWDQYVKEIEALGLEQLKAIHDSSYARVLAIVNGN